MGERTGSGVPGTREFKSVGGCLWRDKLPVWWGRQTRFGNVWDHKPGVGRLSVSEG